MYYDNFMNIKAYLQNFKKNDSSSSPLIMGILNLTPDSFHDGGKYTDPVSAIAQIRYMQKNGVHIIDVGAASSRPGFSKVDSPTEIARLNDLFSVYKISPDSAFSIDTDKAEVAEYAIAHGFSIINNSAGSLDKDMYELAAQKSVPMVIMHRMGEEGRHQNVVEEILSWFDESVSFGLSLGMEKWQFILDPGFGFNKNIEENMAIVENIDRFTELAYPILAAFSHKRFVAAISGEFPGNAPEGNKKMANYMLKHGVAILRMHDVLCPD